MVAFVEADWAPESAARLRNQRFFSLSELNAAIARLVVDLNERPMRRLGVSRRRLFEELDRPALDRLPSEPYVYAEWRLRRVGLDYHVDIDGHLDGWGTALKSGQTDTSATPGGAPLFTCFGSANEGLPRNPVIPFYYETQADAFQYTPNPAGSGFNDLGVGLFLRSLSGINPNSDWIQYAPSVDGRIRCRRRAMRR
jgi:hypothetical protein